MGFGFKSIGHYIAVAARDVVKFGSNAAVLEPAVEGVTAVVAGPAAPSATAIERAGFAALGHITKAANDVTLTGDGQYVSLSLTMLQSEVADFKELYAFFDALRKKQGVVVG